MLIIINSTNETLLFVRFLIRYDFACFHLYYLHFIVLYICAIVIIIYYALACLLTAVAVNIIWHEFSLYFYLRSSYT